MLNFLAPPSAPGMSGEAAGAESSVCPSCGGVLTHGEMCPRCLFGDVLAVLDGPTPPTPAPIPAVSAQRRVGEYELLEELGRGGMGVVWKARQRRLNRIVALKLVRGGCLPGEAAARRFRREAEAAAQLKHPNIVVIHEVGEYDEQLYLSMDLIEGGSLADWLKRVAFSPRDAAALVAKVARGVHHAHEHQVLHRDLKPGNILLDGAGEPRVCDFGLARLGDDESSLTLSGELLGTPAYLSPEQAAGKMKDLTPASDTYSLGAILYELLCGHPPFAADNLPALLRKVAEDDPMRPISHYSGGRIPFDLSTICLKCLEKEPSARYSSALALAEDLERWLRGEPIVARPVRRAERVWKWVRRKPVLAALWLGITVLMVVVAVVATVMSYRLEKERKAVADLADASRHQVGRQLSESAQRYMSDGDYLRALPALAEAIRVGTGDPQLNEADRIRFGVILRFSPKLKNAWLDGRAITRAETTTNGARLLVTTEQTAEVWQVAAGKRVGVPVELNGPVSNIQFDSIAGRWALFEVANQILAWAPDNGKLEKVAEGSIYSAPNAYLHRGPHFITYRQNTAEVRAVADGAMIAGPFEHEAEVAWAILPVDLNRALVSDVNGTLYLWDIAKRALVGPPITLGKGNRRVSFDAYHPEQRLAGIHREKDCWLIDCQTGQIAAENRSVENSPQTLGWDEEGNWHFLARNSDGVTLRKLETDTIRWFGSHHGLGFRGSFAPVAGLVATQSWNGSARIRRISDGRPVTPFVWHTATPGSCILDPMGRWFFTRGDGPAARLWQFADEEPLVLIPDRVEKMVGYWTAAEPDRIFVAEEAGRVRAWEKHGTQKVGEAFHPEGLLKMAGASGDKSRFFTAGARIAQVWHSTTWLPVGSPYRAENDLRAVALDPAGERLAVATADGEVVIQNVASGEIQVRIKPGARRVAFSPDGRLLLVMGDRTAHTWDVQTGQPVSAPVEQAGGYVRARFSPDGRQVVQWSARSSQGQARARVWEAASGQVIAELPPHWLAIKEAVWSPDGKLIATGGEDQTLLLCDAQTGSAVLPPIKHGSEVAALGFSPDGNLLWSLVDKDVTLWQARTGEPVTPTLRQSRQPIGVAVFGDGNDVVVINDRALPKFLSLHPDNRTPEELRTVAHALSGHALVRGTSALRPLTQMELRSAWEKARPFLETWER